MPWLQKKKFDFYWTTTLTTLRSWWEKCSFFILLGRSLWKYLLTWSYIAHGITNLSKKFPNGILPGKNMCNLKKLSSSGISVDSYMIYFPQNCQITDVFKKTDKLLVLLSCSLYLSDFILQSLWGFNNIFFDYERLIS